MDYQNAIQLVTEAIAHGAAIGEADYRAHGDRGTCGGAIVNIRDARQPFVRHLKRAGIGQRAFPGWDISVPLQGNPQTVVSHEVAARGCAAKLAEAGIATFVMTWVD